VGFRADAVRGKTWGVQGQTPVVAVPGQRQSMSAASAVNARGAFWFVTYHGALNAQRFVDYLKRLMKHRKKRFCQLAVETRKKTRQGSRRADNRTASLIRSRAADPLFHAIV